MNEVQNFINEQFGEISTVVRGVQLYLDEENLYNFMFEAKSKRCKDFRNWVVKEVLPTIRKNDYYVSNNISQENYNKLLKELEQKSIWLRGAFGDKVVKIDKVARDLNIPKQSIEHYIKKNKWIDSKGNITKIGARGKILNKDGTIYFGETGMKLICAAIARQKDKQLIDNCLTNGTNIKKI